MTASLLFSIVFFSNNRSGSSDKGAALRSEHLEEVCEHIRLILDASLASMRLTMQGYDLIDVMGYDGV